MREEGHQEARQRSLDWADSEEEMRYERVTSKKRLHPPEAEGCRPRHHKARLRQLRRCSGKRKWRYKEAAGVLVKERLLQEWRTT